MITWITTEAYIFEANPCPFFKKSTTTLNPRNIKAFNESLFQIRFSLPFSAKSGEQLTDEKEAAAFDAAEKGEPLNPKPVEATKPTPDKKGEAPIASDEEKKSNGAHTPV